MHANCYLVIAGTTRPSRRSPAIAGWVAALGEALNGEPFQVVDIQDLGLGLDDEPGLPALGKYTRESTRRWSEMVSAAKGVVFVTPQYNWGYPAPLKNAIDHLYAEWRGKPALLITYGSRGGDKCAAQLREVLGGLNLRLTDTTPGLRLARERIEADDGAVEPETDFEAHREELAAALRELVGISAANSAQQ